MHKIANRMGIIDMVTVGTLQEIFDEMARAEGKYGDKFNSMHEGYAVILAELQEVWDEIRTNNPKRAREEAIQLAGVVFKLLRLLDEETEKVW